MYDGPFFFLALSFILVHEMDAIQCHEWRIFPLTARLNDQQGYLVFTAAHVPLYGLLFWQLFAQEASAASAQLVVGLNIFFMVHVGLHLVFLRHPKNQFTTPFSWLLIVGAAVCGALDLLLS